MSESFPETPVVVLEADFPEQVGKVGLFDYLMPVGSTGIVFVAAVPGRLYQWGPTFTEPVRKAADLRAASTLVQWGLIRGEPFAFLRNALRLSQADIATAYSVSLATVQGWEADTISIPILIWGALANQVSIADGRVKLAEYAIEPNFRPRKVRVFPNIPMVGAQSSPASPPCAPPVTLVGPDCMPPGDPSCC